MGIRERFKTKHGEMNLRYKLIPKKEGIDFKEETIFFWSFILQDTGAGYLFRYGRNTFNANKCIYDGSRTDGSPVSNDGFDVSKEDALVMARLFRGYAHVKRVQREEWEKKPEKEKVMLQSLLGKQAVPPVKEFLQKVESLAEFCEQSEGFNIW